MERKMALGCIIPCFLLGLACQGNTVKEGEKTGISPGGGASGESSEKAGRCGTGKTTAI